MVQRCCENLAASFDGEEFSERRRRDVEQRGVRSRENNKAGCVPRGPMMIIVCAVIRDFLAARIVFGLAFLRFSFVFRTTTRASLLFLGEKFQWKTPPWFCIRFILLRVRFTLNFPQETICVNLLIGKGVFCPPGTSSPWRPFLATTQKVGSF